MSKFIEAFQGLGSRFRSKNNQLVSVENQENIPNNTMDNAEAGRLADEFIFGNRIPDTTHDLVFDMTHEDATKVDIDQNLPLKGVAFSNEDPHILTLVYEEK
jgi:hypothetical protein